MDITSHILTQETIEGVAYELHTSNSIRVFDVESGEVVTHVFYRTADLAKNAYVQTIVAASKTS